jgi:RNA polymerase sigma-70 factor (ECF subfamily)
MSLQETTTSTPLRDLYSTDDKRLRIISTGVPIHRRAAHESTPRSMEADGKAAIASGKSGRVSDFRIERQAAPSEGYDEMLLRDVARGDSSAMRMIFLRHQKRVFRFVLRFVHSHDLAQDVVSQVFLDVWRFAHRFEYRSRVSTWLLSIARFKAINAIRRPTYQNLDELDLPEIVDTSDTPEMALDRKETSRMLQACLAELSPAHRRMLDLFYCHDCSVAEVSERIGIPKATVKSRLFYARKHLARVLVDAGFSKNSVQANLR